MRAFHGLVKRLKDSVGIKKHPWFHCVWDVKHTRNGQVIWEDRKRNSLFDEGERAMLLQFFRAEEAPTVFYLRLAYDTLVETDSLIDVRNEPSGNGYSAATLERSAIGFPTLALNSGDYQLTSKTFSFTASGGNIGPVNVAYLATSSDNSGKLILANALSMSRTILDGDTLEATISIKLS